MSDVQNTQLSLIRAKKMSQLDLIQKIVEVDNSNVVVVMPKLNSQNEWDGETYENKRITLKEFMRHGISSIWKNEIDRDLRETDALPIITFNINNDSLSDAIDVRDGSFKTSKVNKTLSVPLSKLAKFVIENQGVAKIDDVDSAIQAMYNTLIDKITQVEQNTQGSIQRLTNNIETINSRLDAYDSNIYNLNKRLTWYTP